MTAPDSHPSVHAPDKWQEKYRDFFANPAMLGVSGVMPNHQPAPHLPVKWPLRPSGAAGRQTHGWQGCLVIISPGESVSHTIPQSR